jgi:5-oxoprolinase (ATP-hydrolysing) subunit B
VPASLKPRRIADDVIEIACDSTAEAQALAKGLRGSGLADEVVAGLACVAIRFHPASAARLEAFLAGMGKVAALRQSQGEPAVIPVRYGGADGPDLQRVSDEIGLSANAFIDLHSSREHKVDLMGFTPGFSYISGLPDTVRVPRLDQPRPRVPAGSVGVSVAFTGIYALPGPGGWPLIGRTDTQLFTPESAEPFLLSPGQKLTFRPV